MRLTVVGAGIAGLTAAHRRAAAGVDVRVLEREDRPGGRISTQPLGAAVIERGAQFLSTGYELIPELVRTAGLADELVRVSGRTLAVADDRSLRFHTGRPHTLLTSGLLRARDNHSPRYAGCGRPGGCSPAARTTSPGGAISASGTDRPGPVRGSAPASPTG